MVMDRRRKGLEQRRPMEFEGTDEDDVVATGVGGREPYRCNTISHAQSHKDKQKKSYCRTNLFQDFDSKYLT